MSLLSEPRFHDDDAARAYLEGIIWANGVVCPHCDGSEGKRVYEMKGGRPGLRKCGQCRKQFTITVGTVFESSHVPLHKWMQAAYLLSSSKKGFSAHQLHRTLAVTYKTAWFMAHRLREAMKAGNLPPLGGEGKAVEADETYIGRKVGVPKRRAGHHKNVVLALIERGGEARTFHIDRANLKNIAPLVAANIDPASSLMTDQAHHYIGIGEKFAKHGHVHHEWKEWVRGDAHTNTAEGYFSIFKRGMKGVYQHCAEHHLHRYLVEFEFRYNHRIARGVNDPQRAVAALSGIVGKRLTYRRINEATA